MDVFLLARRKKGGPMTGFLSGSKIASLSILLSVLLIVTPLAPCVVLAQDEPTEGTSDQDAYVGCADGERQAEQDIQGSTWFVIGCLAGLIGYVIALQEPNPPATPLLGKDESYVASFTDCYRKKGKKIKSSNALGGCLVGSALTAALYTVIILAYDEEN